MGASVGRVGTSSNHNLEIIQNNSAAITIDTSRNVGIGATSPATKLHVKSDSSSPYQLRLESDGTEKWNIGIGTPNYYDTTLLFQNGTADKMALTSAGNLGIGTNTPDQLLHIYAASGNAAAKIQSNTDNAFLYIDSNQDGSGGEESGIILQDNGSAKWEIFKTSGNDYGIYDYTRASMSFRIKDNGDMGLMEGGGSVGIGTASPGARLEVSSDSNIATIINSTSTFTFIDIENDGANRVQVGNASDGDFIIRTSDSERFRIASGGNATFTGTINSGAITSTGQITGTELEGTSLDINGDADISGTITSGAISCLLYTSPSPRDRTRSRMPSSA